MRHRAFTLVELLVVVAIIGLLLGILVPALGRAREQATIVACKSNLKQIGTAVFAYAGDHDQAIPFGPDAAAITMLDFYRFPGMVTSLVATIHGDPVGLGLAVESYLSMNPQVIFCPGSDQKIIASRELAQFGSAQVQSSYWYRHGSAAYPGDPVLNIRLTGRYANRDGDVLHSLAMDTNFIAAPSLSAFGVDTRTHHQTRHTNTLNLDGSAAGYDNAGGAFTADVGASPEDGPNLILQAFEAADALR
jgi:prepilin-type N-terminal cleavage/methylation domain-containing protein